VDIDHLVPLKNAWISGARSLDEYVWSRTVAGIEKPALSTMLGNC
jgi:hypothetical protein